MSDKRSSVLARLGNNLQTLIDLQSDKKFQSDEDQDLILLAQSHLRNAIYCLYDLGVQRDVNTYVFFQR